jgi:uncharacterized protein YceH (UPF0502 family)
MELTAEELRVLGCLIEKQRTVPDTYPMSLNALRGACNQMTNREPIVSYDEPTIEAALDRLRERHLVRRGVTAGSRVIKYWQLFDEELGLDDAEVAVLCVLTLRGPQTVGELKGRTERLHSFASLDDVGEALDRLAGRDEPLAQRLAREPGRKESRSTHLLGRSVASEPLAGAGGPDAPAEGYAAGASGAPGPGDSDPGDSDPGDVDTLRRELSALRAEVEDLRERVDRLGL